MGEPSLWEVRFGEAHGPECLGSLWMGRSKVTDIDWEG